MKTENLIIKNTLKKEIAKRKEKVRKLYKQIETLENEIQIFEIKLHEKG